MKKKMILAIAAIMVLGLSIAGFAFTRTTLSSSMAMSCCCSGDSCPMKKKDASTGEKASCCDNCDCCSGDSCPMKTKGEASMTGMKMAEGESCPMMKKGEAAQATASSATDDKTEAKSCACTCCNKDKNAMDTPAV